jgi:aminopeptidase I
VLYSGRYFVVRNGSSLVAFVVGQRYASGDGMAMVVGHMDALTARLKQVCAKRLGVEYSTWWDRDLGVGGRVLIKDPQTGRITTELVKLDWPSE